MMREYLEEAHWKRQCQRIGNTQEKALSKLLLEQMDGGKGIEAYRKYLRSTVFPTQSTSQLSKLSPELLELFYVKASPGANPKFFAPLERSSDLARLERALDERIVLMKPFKRNLFLFLHDRRIFDLIGSKGKNTNYFVLEPVGKHFSLYRAPDAMGCDVVSVLVEQCLVAKVSNLEADSFCYVERLLKLLEKDPGLHDEHWPDHGCRKLSRFFRSGEKLEAEIQDSVTFVSHLKTELGSRKVTDHSYIVMSQCGSSRADCKVVGISPEEKLYLFCESKRPIFRDLKADSGVAEKYPGLMEAEKKKIVENTSDFEKSWGGCGCQCCLSSARYAKNIEGSGPSVLYDVKLPLIDLLKFVNLDTDENEKLILMAVEYSFASFDIESAASNLETEEEKRRRENASKKGPRAIYAKHNAKLIGYLDSKMISDGEEAKIFGDWRDPTKDDREDFVGEFVQHLLERKEQMKELKEEILKPLFDWTEKYRSAHYEHFLSAGFIDSSETTEKKAGLMDITSEDFEFEELLCRSDAPVEKECAAEAKERYVELAFRSSIFGKVEEGLKRLVNNFKVFGFNAEGFDLPLILSSVVLYAKENGLLGLKVRKEGSKIRSLSFESIELCELKRLVTPGFSLASLAKVCGLSEEGEKKGIFPFGLFTGSAFLREKQLPKEAKLWSSDLNPDKSPTQEDVNEALQVFQELKLKDVGDYLVHYLKKDCKLTQVSASRLMRSYYDMMRIHPVESNKLTVSSLASAAVQLYLARRKKIGFLFVNDPLKHSVRIAFICFLRLKKKCDHKSERP